MSARLQVAFFLAAALAVLPVCANAAPDKSPGMAIMAADVDYSAGILLRSSGVVSSERVAAGRYRLVFARDISDCYVVATTYGAGVGRGYALTWLKSGSQIDVVTCETTLDCNTTPADQSFNIIAFCPK